MWNIWPTKCSAYIVNEPVGYQSFCHPTFPAPHYLEVTLLWVPCLDAWALPVRPCCAAKFKYRSFPSFSHLLASHYEACFLLSPYRQCEEWKSFKKMGMRNRNEESRKGLGKMSVCNTEFIIFPFVSFFLFPTHLLF